MIEDWKEFEDDVNKFIKDSIQSNNQPIFKRRQIENIKKIESHDDYKYLITHIFNNVFSNCLFENVFYKQEPCLLAQSGTKGKQISLNVDICCAKLINEDWLFIVETKTIKNISFKDKNDTLLSSNNIVSMFGEKGNSNYKGSIEQIFSYMIYANLLK